MAIGKNNCGFSGTFLASLGLGEPLRGWEPLWAGIGYVWGESKTEKKS